MRGFWIEAEPPSADRRRLLRHASHICLASWGALGTRGALCKRARGREGLAGGYRAGGGEASARRRLQERGKAMFSRKIGRCGSVARGRRRIMVDLLRARQPLLAVCRAGRCPDTRPNFPTDGPGRLTHMARFSTREAVIPCAAAYPQRCARADMPHCGKHAVAWLCSDASWSRFLLSSPAPCCGSSWRAEDRL